MIERSYIFSLGYFCGKYLYKRNVKIILSVAFAVSKKMTQKELNNCKLFLFL